MNEEEKKALEVNSFDEVPTDYTGEVVKFEESEHDYGEHYISTVEHATFENGVREGKTTILNTSMRFNDGEYYEDNRYLDRSHPALCEIPYHNGKIQGVVREYDENGVLMSESPYVAGKKHGIEKIYNGLGSVLQTTEYKQGQKDGREIYNGIVKRNYNYKHGKMDGIQVSYYDDGFIEETYADGKKVSVKNYVQGTITYNDGRVAKISEEEMKNSVGTLEKIANAKKRLHKHFENPKENAKVTEAVRSGMDKATPIKEVAADAPFKVVPNKRGGMGE